MMTIKSYKDIEAFERQYPAICGRLVTALLKDRYLIGTNFTKDGPVCFRQSATFRAALAGQNLHAEFNASSAVEAWLQWIDAFRGGVTIRGNPTPVVVDWHSGIFRRAVVGRSTPWAYGCVEDVQHGLFDRREWSGRIRLQPAPEDVAKSNGSQAPTDPLTDIRQAEQSLANEPETTRQTLIEARLGQGAFRESLMNVWAGKCAVTKCATKSLLRASHIKPWRDSTNQERLDRFNGFLLNPVLDAAFDRGLISFSNAGGILFQLGFPSQEREILGLLSTLRLVCVFDENKPYLAHHRRLHGFPP